MMKYPKSILIASIIFTVIISSISCSAIDVLQLKTSVESGTNNKNEFSLLTYNIEAISHKEEDQINNLLSFVNKQKFNFLLFQELFSEATRDDLIKNIDTNFYRTIISRVDFNSFPDFLFQDSGLLMLSNYPLVDISAIDFGDDINNNDLIIYKILSKEFSRTYDFLANKAVLGALFQISKKEKLFLFTTHVQALGSNENKEYQIQQIFDFIASALKNCYEHKIISEDENLSVILAGDFNVDAYNNTWNQNRVTQPKLLSILGNPRDLHMEFNGDKREYTWNFRSGSHPRRFDYVLAYDTLLNFSFNKIKVGSMKVIDIKDNQNKSISDHKGISTKLLFDKK